MIRARIGRWRIPQAVRRRGAAAAGVAAVFADQDAPVTGRKRHRIGRVIPVRSEVVVEKAAVGIPGVILRTDEGAVRVVEGNRYPFARCQACMGNIDANVFRFIDPGLVVVVETHMGAAAVDEVAQKSSA